MADIPIPTTKTVYLETGKKYTIKPTAEGNFVFSLKSDRGVPTCALTEDETILAEGTSLFNRSFPVHIKSEATLVADATISETVMTLDVATAPASTYGTVTVDVGIKHQINFVPDSNHPETQTAVIYFGSSIAASVQEVFAHDGDIIIPAHATAHVPTGHGIVFTPLVEQTKEQA